MLLKMTVNTRGGVPDCLPVTSAPCLMRNATVSGRSLAHAISSGVRDKPWKDTHALTDAPFVNSFWIACSEFLSAEASSSFR